MKNSDRRRSSAVSLRHSPCASAAGRQCRGFGSRRSHHGASSSIRKQRYRVGIVGSRDAWHTWAYDARCADAKIPVLPIVILSASESREDMQRGLEGGALGFIQKSATPAIMLSALRLVLAGGVYVPPALVQFAVQISAQTLRSIRSPPAHDKRDDLTPRQSDVLARVIEASPTRALPTNSD